MNEIASNSASLHSPRPSVCFGSQIFGFGTRLPLVVKNLQNPQDFGEISAHGNSVKRKIADSFVAHSQPMNLPTLLVLACLALAVSSHLIELDATVTTAHILPAPQQGESLPVAAGSKAGTSSPRQELGTCGSDIYSKIYRAPASAAN
jgi:hypothetical protein